MSRRGSLLVAIGILLSRITGLVRNHILAKYLGISAESDIWNNAIKIPNFLQNLFGEGALSAAFIPSYARLIGEGRDDEARRLAGAILSLLMCVVAAIVLAGEVATPGLVVLLTPGFDAEKRALTERLVRILFPGAGLMVLSAWCLGVLNSHRRFLLSYAAPVIWNAAIIGAILTVAITSGANDLTRFVVVAAWGALLGSFLQVLIQVPVVFGVGGAIRLVDWRGVSHVRRVIEAAIPNVVSRGANQISAYIDLTIANLIPGAVTALANAQLLYTLPVSLFGMAISAAELPEMARATGDREAIAHTLRIRLSAATQRMAYYVVPSAMGFLSLGGVIAAAVLQTGRFTHDDSTYVWIVLAGSATGLLASTLGRLYASTFFALGDTRTPLKYGLVRIALTGVLGLAAALALPPMLGLAPRWGAAGISASAGVAGWIEFALLRRGLCRHLGEFDLPMLELVKLWSAAMIAAALSILLQGSLPPLHPVPLALVLVPANAFLYLGITIWWDIPEAAVLSRKLQHLLRR